MSVNKKLYINPGSINFSELSINYEELSLKSSTNPIELVGPNGYGKTALSFFLAGIIPDIIYASTSLRCDVTLGEKLFRWPHSKDYFTLIPQNTKLSILGYKAQKEIIISNSGGNAYWTNYLFEAFEIHKIPSIPIGLLSDGEKRRIVICAALNTMPSILISDEWTQNLDITWQSRINNIFIEYYKLNGFHINFSSHPTNIPDVNRIDLKSLIKNKQNVDTQICPGNIVFNDIKRTYFEQLKNERFDILDINATVVYNLISKREINISGKSGDIIEIIGQNGSGKTTLLKNLWKQTKKINKSRIYLIMTNPIYQVLGPSIMDEISKLDFHNNEIETNFKKFILDILGINLNRDVLLLSYGQRKILAIIIALFSKSGIVCMDEPFSGLDLNNSKILSELIKMVSGSGKIIIFTTHEYHKIDDAKSINLD